MTSRQPSYTVAVCPSAGRGQRRGTLPQQRAVPKATAKVKGTKATRKQKAVDDSLADSEARLQGESDTKIELQDLAITVGGGTMAPSLSAVASVGALPVPDGQPAPSVVVDIAAQDVVTVVPVKQEPKVLNPTPPLDYLKAVAPITPVFVRVTRPAISYVLYWSVICLISLLICGLHWTAVPMSASISFSAPPLFRLFNIWWRGSKIRRSIFRRKLALPSVSVPEAYDSLRAVFDEPIVTMAPDCHRSILTSFDSCVQRVATVLGEHEYVQTGELEITGTVIVPETTHDLRPINLAHVEFATNKIELVTGLIRDPYLGREIRIVWSPGMADEITAQVSVNEATVRRTECFQRARFIGNYQLPAPLYGPVQMGSAMVAQLRCMMYDVQKSGVNNLVQDFQSASPAVQCSVWGTAALMASPFFLTCLMMLRFALMHLYTLR